MSRFPQHQGGWEGDSPLWKRHGQTSPKSQSNSVLASLARHEPDFCTVQVIGMQEPKISAQILIFAP